MNEQQSAEVGIKVISVIPVSGLIGAPIAPAAISTGYNSKVYV